MRGDLSGQLEKESFKDNPRKWYNLAKKAKLFALENGCLYKSVDGHSCRMLGEQTEVTEAIRLAREQAGRFGRRAAY